MIGFNGKKFKLIFWVELLTIVTIFLWLNYVSRFLLWISSSQPASRFWIVGMIAVLLLMWVVSRAFIWWLLVRKGFLWKAILIGTPFMALCWLLLGFLFWMGYKLLTPVLLISPSWLAYIIAYIVLGALLAPATFAVSGVSSLAFYGYLKHGKYDWFLFGIPLLKQKNLYTLVYFVKQAYIIGAGFVMLMLISQLTSLLPLVAELAILAVLLALFLAWSKLHMLNTVLSK